MSAGAIGAGAQVVLGCDSSATPLKLWSSNVGVGGRAVLAKLGTDEITLPPAAIDLHIHASPPCQALSRARGAVPEAELAEGVASIRWSLDLVLGRGDCSWSLENCNTPAVVAVIDEYATRYPDRVAHAAMDAADFGACQTRTRCIAGPPAVIRHLQERAATRRICVREAFEAASVPLQATHFRNQSTRGGVPCVRSVENLAFTVCAGHGLTWCDARGATVRVMTARESAVLMGFPTDWRLPAGSRAAQTAAGNAMCVPLARCIMEAAMATAAVSSMSSPASQPMEPRDESPSPMQTATTEAAESEALRHSEGSTHGTRACGGCRKMKKRVRALEAQMRELYQRCMPESDSENGGLRAMPADVLSCC